MKILTKNKEAWYEGLPDALYNRRGQNSYGVPTIGFSQKIGMDLPEVIDVVRDYQ